MSLGSPELPAPDAPRPPEEGGPETECLCPEGVGVGAAGEGVIDANWNLWVGLPVASNDNSMKCSSGIVIVVGAD